MQWDRSVWVDTLLADRAHRHDLDEGEVIALAAAPGDQAVDLVIVHALQGHGVDLDLKAGVLGGGQALHHLVELAPAGARLELVGVQGVQRDVHPRSEEHTSELQSLMRISYAVFFLKKKKH